MSLSSTRLGLLLIGIGILLLGFYLNRKHYDGFQASTTMPDVSALKSKDADIRNKLMLITNTKLLSDIALVKLLPTDLIASLNIIYGEVGSYVNKFKSENLSSLEATDLNKLNQIIYTISDNVDMLYSIYYTIPSSIISSKSVINPDSAPPFSVSSENILTAAIPEITEILSKIPNPKTKVQSLVTQINSNVKTVATDQSDLQISNLIQNVQQLQVVVNAVLENMTSTIGSLSVNYASRAATDSSVMNKITLAYNDKITFQTTIISSLESIVTSLKDISNPAPPINQLISNINNTTDSIRTGMTTDKNDLNKATVVVNNNTSSAPRSSTPTSSILLPPTQSTTPTTPAAPTAPTAPAAPTAPMTTGMTEGFASYMNPYNQPSPSISQAYEFRLGKNSYLDEIFKSIQSW